MKLRYTIIALMSVSAMAACSNEGGEADEKKVDESSSIAPGSVTAGQEVEIVPGLTMKVLKNGYGRPAVAGDVADVHYTGWLYDPQAGENRGRKFDSSVDRDERFQFPLGAGAVIKGWDQGVEGMLIGEKRELTIAPELAYGERGAGGAIPPGATLIFEVELFGLRGSDAAVEQEQQ